MNSRVEAVLAEFDLRFARFFALLQLYFSRHGSLALGKMSERLMVHPASVTSLVDGLEKGGLITRVPHATDRRTVLAEITPAGRQVVETVQGRLAAISAGMDGLTEAESVQLLELLTKFRRADGEFEPTRR
jgi:DNA-binding MarR family transcriptional regulator